MHWPSLLCRCKHGAEFWVRGRYRLQRKFASWCKWIEVRLYSRDWRGNRGRQFLIQEEIWELVTLGEELEILVEEKEGWRNLSWGAGYYLSGGKRLPAEADFVRHNPYISVRVINNNRGLLSAFTTVELHQERIGFMLNTFHWLQTKTKSINYLSFLLPLLMK